MRTFSATSMNHLTARIADSTFCYRMHESKVKQSQRIFLSVIDNSGFRMHYSRHLRKEDGGIMISGVSVSDTQLIPPQQKLYRNIGICGPSCTSAVSSSPLLRLSESHSHRLTLSDVSRNRNKHHFGNPPFTHGRSQNEAASHSQRHGTGTNCRR